MRTDPAKWLTVLPLQYDSALGFWDRDAGLLCLSLIEAGADCRLVALGPSGVQKDQPLILASLEEMKTSAWWLQWKAEVVVLYSWAAPRYEPVARAIKASGARLIIRMDSDGLKSPRLGFFPFFKILYYSAKDSKKPYPFYASLVRTLAFRFCPAVYDRKVRSHLSHADFILIESPMAKQLLGRYLRMIGGEDSIPKIKVSPHVVKSSFKFSNQVTKRPIILGVARWNALQKDGPLFAKVLGMALQHNKDYAAVLIGSGGDFMKKLCGKFPPSVQQRIQIMGPQPHSSLLGHYQGSRILMFTSRFEGFPVSAGEALACGCTIIGPATLPSLNYIGSLGSGTLAPTRSAEDLAAALECEMDMWRRGERNPESIGEQWHSRVSSYLSAQELLRDYSPTQ
ncbi:MAG TPA: glycosyltransferase [Verrucomicrobiae bacterium]